MMKKLVLTSLLVIVVSALMLGGCAKPAPAPAPTLSPSPTPSPAPAPKPAPAPPPAPSPTTPAKVIELSYSNFFPPTHLHVILANEWAKEIGKRTNGAVKITQFPGGSLTPAPKIYDGVVQGISDIGMSALTYTPGRFSVSELIDMPHAYPNGWVATKVGNDFYKQFKPAEFKDVQVLYFHDHGPGMILTTKKPVRKLEDLRGLVLRSTGVGAQIVETLGGTGYAAAQGEAYELMSKGVIDGSFTPLEVLKGWKQAEVVKYVTLSKDVGNTTDFFVVMNKAKFDTMPANIQKVFTDVSEEWIEKHAKVWSYYDKVAIDYFKTFEGRELIQLSPDEMARWVKAAAPLKEKHIANLTAKGLPGADFEKYLNDRVKYWTEKSLTDDDCVKWVKAEVEPLAPPSK